MKDGAGPEELTHDLLNTSRTVHPTNPAGPVNLKTEV